MERHRKRDHHGHTASRPQRSRQWAVLRPPSTAIPASATFNAEDTATQGNWINVYGTTGYDLVNDATSIPSYAYVAPVGDTVYNWTTTSSDPRALETPGSSNRVAAVWYSTTSFTIDVDVNNGQANDIGLYVLDWDKQGRSEQIQVSSATTGAILDTETVSNFSGGAYLQWNVTGNVVFTVTRLAGPSAVVDGVFIDPRPLPGAAASWPSAPRRP